MAGEGFEAGWTGSKAKAVLSFAQGVVPLVIAVAVLLIFWGLVKSMMGLTKAPELEWNRAAYLFSGVEAIAYAAAGFLFGREVHRQRAEQAEQRAGSEQQRASEAEKKATEETTKGQTLRRVIEAKKSTRLERAPDMEGLESFQAGGGPAQAAGQSDIDELSRVSSELFPYN
ncbi:MAG TPA: hypothetical protein VF668_00975 [Pyrinomonadaceae bacterium]|jgi:hypothetical protein